MCEQVGRLAALDSRHRGHKINEYLAPTVRDHGRFPDIFLDWEILGKFTIKFQTSNAFEMNALLNRKDSKPHATLIENLLQSSRLSGWLAVSVGEHIRWVKIMPQKGPDSDEWRLLKACYPEILDTRACCVHMGSRDPV